MADRPRATPDDGNWAACSNFGKAGAMSVKRSRNSAKRCWLAAALGSVALFPVVGLAAESAMVPSADALTLTPMAVPQQQQESAEAMPAPDSKSKAPNR